MNRKVSICSAIPSWPNIDPQYGNVRLRRFEDRDAAMAADLSRDPYVPLIGTLPSHASEQECLAWVERQRQRHVEGIGFSFSIADRETDRSLGNIGLWVREMEAGRAQAGYGIAPRARGQNIASDALCALTAFAWTIPVLHRVELYIEPWNTASIRTAERAGYEHEGLLRSHQEIAGKRSDMLLYARIRVA